MCVFFIRVYDELYLWVNAHHVRKIVKKKIDESIFWFGNESRYETQNDRAAYFRVWVMLLALRWYKVRIFTSFMAVGLICMIASLIYDTTKFTPGHITSLFVVIGGLLGIFGFYDVLMDKFGYGLGLPITSFGNSLVNRSTCSLIGKFFIDDQFSTGIYMIFQCNVIFL